MKCSNVEIKRRRICLGDLNKKIIIKLRSISSPEVLNDYDYDVNFTNEKQVWSAIQTTKGLDVFDGVNLVGQATHFFYIKYIDEIDSDSMIEYSGKNYRILQSENMDENNEFLKLYCNERGDSDIEVNQQ